MNENRIDGDSFVGYEYKEVTVAQQRAAMYLDGYESFGWQTDEHFTHSNGATFVTLHLRRDRKIINKMELTRLQRNFEASMDDISSLEKSRTAVAQIVALSVGILGTAFMAGATFAVTADTPLIWLCIMLAIPGFIGWAVPYFLYCKLVQKRTAVVSPLIEQKYDEIYELCKKGNSLLS